MRACPVLGAPGRRASVEPAVRAAIAGHGSMKIVGPRGWKRFIRLLTFVRLVSELAIEQRWNCASAEYGFDGRQAHPPFAAPML